MDVVPDAGSVFCRVILAEDAEFLSLLDDDLLHEGEQVIGVLVGLVSEQVRLMCATWVEIPERYDPPIWVCSGQRT